MTSDVIVDRRRTSAATAARRRAKVQRMVFELALRLDELNDEWLAALAEVVAGEVEARRESRGKG